MDCYRYKEYYFDSGIFDESVDVTFILTMKNSIDRHEEIYKQLETHHPTSKVIIVYNTGFRECKKSSSCGKIDISYKDLTHAVMNIFSLSKKYNRILILEDDFIFNNNTLTKDISNINKFLTKYNPNIYSLGSIHLLFNPFTYKNKRLYCKFANHAMVYNKNARELLFKIYNNCNTIIHDIDFMTCFKSSCYGYHKNIYAQVFEDTENNKNWGKGCKYIPDFILNLSFLLFKMILKIFGLNKKNNINDKFNNFNFVLYLLHYLVILMLLYLVIIKTGIVKIFY